MPATVKVVGVAVVAAGIATGETEVMLGTGFVTDSVTGLELPPPGGGFETTICKIPALATFDEPSVAVRVVELITDVEMLKPFTAKVVSDSKFCPYT